VKLLRVVEAEVALEVVAAEERGKWRRELPEGGRQNVGLAGVAVWGAWNGATVGAR